jgi:hypothetical protein
VLRLDDGGEQESVNAIAFTASGRIDIGGYVSNRSSGRCAIARFDADGSLDRRFSGNGIRLVDLSDGAEQVNDLVALSCGEIVAAGSAEHDGLPRFVILRLHSSGAFATDFERDGVARTDLGPGADVANAIAWTRSGAFAVAGSAGNAGHRDWGLVRT